MKNVLIGLSCLFLSGCNYSITLVHTEGTASDVVDEAASNTPTTTIPIR